MACYREKLYSLFQLFKKFIRLVIIALIKYFFFRLISNIRTRKLLSGVNWQGAFKQEDIKQKGVKKKELGVQKCCVLYKTFFVVLYSCLFI